MYDGNSYKSPLIGSFSGKTNPDNIVAQSGFMLILLYSDSNYVLDGFTSDFFITNCLRNCSDLNGVCLNHSCLCTGNWIGEDCSVRACDCGQEDDRGHCENDRCICHNGFSGQTCSLRKHNPEPSQWHFISNSTMSFTKRAAHSAVYDEKSDSVFLFGGYDLNNVLGNLEVYRFNTSTWEDEHGNLIRPKQTDESTSKAVLRDLLLERDLQDMKNLGLHDQFWFRAALLSHIKSPHIHLEEVTQGNYTIKIQPLPRYGHAACAVNGSFIIYGGKLANHKLASDLWLYNISTREWSLRAAQSKLSPPKLTRHTLTFVSTNNYIYLFGGALVTGDFSSGYVL